MKKIVLPVAMAIVAIAAFGQGAATQPATTAAAAPQASMVMHYVIESVLAVLALGSVYLAWTTHRSLNRLRDNYIEDIEAVNANMQKFAEDIAKQVEALKASSRQDAQARLAAACEQIVEENSPVKAQEPEKLAKAKSESKKTLYLTRPDGNDCFTRAAQEFELGNSIFVLTTTDGKHGKYKVIDDRNVHRLALMMPSENLTPVCKGNNIQLSAGKTRIVTDREGEAVLENGVWHVTVKAVIHYE